jgi:sterol desaturase/sphingolipid hydroxylase (fatty acid hydroxylase superfamily)
MLLGIAMFLLGLFAWTLVEYVIHGFMSHIFETFATPLHAAHHRDPRAVFTVGAWLPVAIVTAIVVPVFGLNLGVILWVGVVTGFLGYELFHYRIHFAEPVCELEQRLRLRHLAHHFAAPGQIFGVTNRWWDRVFGSEPDALRLAAMEAAMGEIRPLSGASNFRLILRPWFFLSR